jgi:hypothetical protein
MGRKKGFRIPGVTFSWKRALGITSLKRKIAKATGIPTTREGRRRKFGRHGEYLVANVVEGAASLLRTEVDDHHSTGSSTVVVIELADQHAHAMPTPQVIVGRAEALPAIETNEADDGLYYLAFGCTFTLLVFVLGALSGAILTAYLIIQSRH